MTVAVVRTARELTDRIKVVGAELYELLVEAYQTAAWLELGYSSWLEYCAEEFDANQLRLPADERGRVIAALADVGMSQREIGAATGVDQATVSRSLSDADASADDLDEDAQAPEPPKPPSRTRMNRPPLPETAGKVAHDIRKINDRLVAIRKDRNYRRNADSVHWALLDAVRELQATLNTISQEWT